MDATILERGQYTRGMISRVRETWLTGRFAARAREGAHAEPTRTASRGAASRGSAHRLVMRVLSFVPMEQRLVAGFSRDSAGLLAACRSSRFVAGQGQFRNFALGVAP